MGEFWLGILGTVAAAIIVSIILGIVWMRKAIADQKEAHGLMDQRLKYNEDKLSRIEEDHSNQYKDLSGKMDQTLEVLTDIKLAFAEVRLKNEANKEHLDALEKRVP